MLYAVCVYVYMCADGWLDISMAIVYKVMYNPAFDQDHGCILTHTCIYIYTPGVDRTWIVTQNSLKRTKTGMFLKIPCLI